MRLVGVAFFLLTRYIVGQSVATLVLLAVSAPLTSGIGSTEVASIILPFPSRVRRH